MNSIGTAIVCAAVPVVLIMFPGFVAGYFGGFSLDCRGSSPGISAGLASAVFYLVFFAPVTIPATLIGAAIGWIGVRRHVPQWPRRFAGLSLVGIALGLCAAVIVALLASPYPTDPMAKSLSPRHWSELLSIGVAGGGLLGLIASFVVVIRSRPSHVVDPNADSSAE